MTSEPPEMRPSARILLPAVVVGWAVIAYGAWSAWHDAADAHPVALVVHVVVFAVVHDALLAPAVYLAGWLVGRMVPTGGRGPVRAALAASALGGAIAYPMVRGWGRRPTNSSTLPLDYGRNLLILVAALWLLAAAVILVRWRRRASAAGAAVTPC